MIFKCFVCIYEYWIQSTLYWLREPVLLQIEYFVLTDLRLIKDGYKTTTAIMIDEVEQQHLVVK